MQIFLSTTQHQKPQGCTRDSRMRSRRYSPPEQSSMTKSTNYILTAHRGLAQKETQLPDWGLFSYTPRSMCSHVYSHYRSRVPTMWQCNALLIVMKIAHELSVPRLESYSDLMLIVNQVRCEFEVCYEDLLPYHTAATQIAGLFMTFYIQHISCNQKSYADALASLATSLALQPGASKEILVLTQHLYYPKSAVKEVFTPIGNIQDKSKEFFETSVGLELRV